MLLGPSEGSKSEMKFELGFIETEATDRTETKIDLPKETIQEDPAEEIRNQKRYVREMARKFGWKLVMKRKRS